LETIQQAAPAEVVMQVLGGHPMKPCHPILQSTVVSIPVLDVPDTVTAVALPSLST
jgi:hypothetical protein